MTKGVMETVGNCCRGTLVYVVLEYSVDDIWR